ncbi:hydroxysteroid 11-beta-dehydrogenase 1-like protein [Bombina bombina]|uniref:hydroxysteroid 11-beta-dehydrogenase 1-like protein n=1 Tax=Bombina bombina TaxID=8345 RepID=UPI00235B0CEE|nr:hydroxysteroid 11-beta-dehydrogenase 1-like protein [Bombina bombina]
MGLLAKGWGIIALVGILHYYYRDSFDPAILANAKVLVTGASTGIGEEIAYHYSRAGAELVLTARRENALQKVRKKCLELGAKKVSLVLADMGSPEAPAEVIQQAVTALGGLDYIVLNHIGWTPFEMWNGDVNHTRWLMEVNFLSFVHLATAALPYLEKSGGSIIVVSSLTGKISIPYTTSYAATKYALEGFFGSLRHELSMKKSPVSITLCILGLIDTQSAMEKIKDKISMTAYPAQDAALAVVSAGAVRLRETYYPWYVRYACFFRDWFPESRDWVIQYMHH